MRNLTKTKTELENTKAALEERLKELVSQGNADATEIANLKAQIDELTAEKNADEAEIKRLNDLIELKDKLFTITYEEAIRLQKELEKTQGELTEAKENSKNIVDEANKQIKQANQDQVDILDAVNKAKKEINNN